MYITKISIISFLVLSLVISSGCMGKSPDKTVMKFIEDCQVGDWASAETMLSSTGKMYFDQNEPMEKMLWPVLGMAVTTGVSVEYIKTKLPTAVIIISNDTSSTQHGSVRVKINNSEIVDPEVARKIMASTGLKSIDFVLKISLEQESNRWKVKNVIPDLDDRQQKMLEQLAKKSPSSL